MHPFLAPDFEVKWSTLTAEVIEDDIGHALEVARGNIQAICDQDPAQADYDSTFGALEDATELLDRGWGRLHRTGIWYLMFIYAYTYLGRVLEAAAPWPVFALTLMLALVGLRFGVWWSRRRARGGDGSVAAARR